MDTPLLIALVATCIAAGAIAQSLTGAGFSLVAAPALMAYFGPTKGVAIVVVLAALSSIVPLSRQFKSVRYRESLSLLVPILLATPVVAMALAGVNKHWVAVAAGLSVIVGVALLARGASWSWFRGLPGAIGAAVASAILNVVGGVGGPPLGMYAANSGWTATQSRATLQFVLLVQNLATALIIGFVMPPLWMIGVLLAGTIVGTALAGRCSPTVARNALLVVAGVGGVALVVGSA